MTFRVIPHVMEAGVAAGTGAAVANRIRQHSGQALSAIPHPATQFAGAAMNGRWGGATAAARTAGAPTPSAPPPARPPADPARPGEPT
jgi:hypothetical protein